MAYLIYILIISIPIAALFGILCAYKKIPRSYFLLLLFTLISIPLVAFKNYERSFALSVVPDALHVKSTSYSKEESWGFGPGGNEAGIRIYPLPSKIADEISQKGMDFFNHLLPNSDQKQREWRGRYEQWSQTPISASSDWKLDKKTGRLNIYDYICAYGFCIDIDDAVVKEATEIINSKGSYYAYGRVGLIVVSPSKKLVVYMYNG